MPTAHSTNRTNSSSSLARRLAWPGTISLVLVAIAACGGSSSGDNDFNEAHAGSGSAGKSSTGTTAGHNSGTSGSSSVGNASGSSSAGNATGGKHGVSEPPAGGDSSSGPDDGGAGGEPGMPPKPGDPKPGDPKPGDPKPPLGMAGAAGLDEDCPLEPPADKAACTEDKLKCDYPDISCNCAGPEDDRNWKCKQPPKPMDMDMCPQMPPVDASACKTQAPPAAPCHYADPVTDCACTADKWTCATAP